MLKIKGKIDSKSGNGKYKGMITLMFKSGELEVVKNWRAITLLNVDYKIISILPVERLKRVLATIINTGQKGFVNERNIYGENVLLQDIIDYTNMEDKKVAIIFLDQQITSLELNMSELKKAKVRFWRVIQGVCWSAL